MFHAVLSNPVTKLPVWLAPLLSVADWLPTVAVPAFTVSVAVTDLRPVISLASCN